MASAQGALYEILYPYLRDYGGVWGQRAQPLAVATATLAKPALLFFAASSGRGASAPGRDVQEITLTVKVVALDLQTAVDGQEEISAALHDSGTQDINPRLPAHAGWVVRTVTEDRAVWFEDFFEGTQRIYEAGYQYQIVMERI